MNKLTADQKKFLAKFVAVRIVLPAAICAATIVIVNKLTSEDTSE